MTANSKRIDRFLAYRDRYVFALQQEIHGGCGGKWGTTLKRENNKITINVSEEEFTELFSALLCGADLMYPYRSHEIVWRLWRGVECPDNLQNTQYGDENSGGRAGSNEELDDFLELMRKLDMKYRVAGKLYEAVIDLVECGCSDGAAGGSGSSGSSIQGGSSGGGYGEDVSLLDLCSNVDVLINAYDAALDKIGTGAYIADIFSTIPGFEEVIKEVRFSLASIQDALVDTDFVRIIKNIVVKLFNDPIGALTRQDLRNFAYKVPLVFGGAPVWAGFVLASELVDLQQLNVGLEAVIGTGSYTGECYEVFQAAGRTPYQAPANISEDFRAGNVYDFTVAAYASVPPTANWDDGYAYGDKNWTEEPAWRAGSGWNRGKVNPGTFPHPHTELSFQINSYDGSDFKIYHNPERTFTEVGVAIKANGVWTIYSTVAVYDAGESFTTVSGEGSVVSGVTEALLFKRPSQGYGSWTPADEFISRMELI